MADPNTNFDPAFGSAAENLRAAAAAKGITTHYISGVRSLDDQKQLYANYQAGLHGQPLPYPARGRVPLAAVPGTSMHERGLAADIEADDPNQEAALRAMAPQFGLRTIGPSDPNHFEIARGAVPKSGGVPGDFAYGGGAAPVQVASADSTPAYAEPAKAPDSPAVAAINKSAPPVGQPSGPMSHEQFIRDYAAKIGVNPDQAVAIARAEGLNAWSSSNPNAASYVDRTSGQPFSFGDFQLNIHPGAVGAGALKAGIDPRDPNQWQAADQYALDQMKQHGVGAWTDPAARAITAHGGLTLNTSQPQGIVDPSIVAHGGTSPAIPDASAPAAAPAAPSFGQAIASGDVGGALKAALTKPTTTDAKGNTVEGKSPLQKLAGAVGDIAEKPAPAPAPIQQAMPAQDPDPGLAPAASQLFQTVAQSAARPLSWSSAPYGANAGLQMTRPGGTTLNATDYGYG